MGKIISFLVFLIALAYVVWPQPTAVQTVSVPEEINFWGIYDLPDVYQPVMEEFQKTHPNIKVVYKQFATAEEYHQVTLAQLQKGKGPDIFLFSDAHRPEYVPFINPTSSEWVQGFSPYVKEVLSTNRLLFGLPLWVDSLVLYYNKKMYPDGIKNQWYEFAEQTKTVNGSGIAMGSLESIRSGWDILKALFLQKSIKLSGVPENNLFDVLEFFNRFAYPIDSFFNWNENLSENYPDLEIDSFARERVGAIAGYSSIFSFLDAKTKQLSSAGLRGVSQENIGIAPFPQFTPDQPKYLGKYFFLTVSVSSKLPNQSWEFIRFLTNETNATYYQQMTGRTAGRIIPTSEADSDLQKIQKLQLPFVSPLLLSPQVQERIENIMKRANKDKRVLREILEEPL